MWQMVMAASSSNMGVYKYGANGVCDYELLCMGWGNHGTYKPAPVKEKRQVRIHFVSGLPGRDVGYIFASSYRIIVDQSIAQTLDG